MKTLLFILVFVGILGCGKEAPKADMQGILTSGIWGFAGGFSYKFRSDGTYGEGLVPAGDDYSNYGHYKYTLSGDSLVLLSRGAASPDSQCNVTDARINCGGIDIPHIK